jgi:ABC-type antimicrobial peptide transport system permease subunit
MVVHYLRIIYRNIYRSRSAFIINLIGLSTGLCCAILIGLWVRDEIQTDAFHSHNKQLFQVMVNDTLPASIHTHEGTSALLAETLIKEMPAVAQATTVTPAAWFQKFTVSLPGQDISAIGQFAGREFFSMFSYELVQGDAHQVLQNKNSIVISGTLARKLFRNTTEVVGKTVEWSWLNVKKQAVITGVFSDVPANSTSKFDFVLPFEAWSDFVPPPADIRGGPFITYVLLREDASVADFNRQLANVVHSKYPDVHASLFIRPYAEAYLYGTYENGVQAGGRIVYVKVFTVIAVLILVLACINFMNLSTARAARRLKEIGIKKVVGAQRSVLIVQYMGESMLMTVLSALVALGLTQLLMPLFNDITGKALSFSPDGQSVALFAGVVFITGLLAGSYPALYLSSFNPVTILKGSFNGTFGEVWLRKGLVVFQFTLSIVFIAYTLIVTRQIDFIQQQDTGFKKDHVIHFDMEGEVFSHPETFLTELRKIPGVEQASTMQQNIMMSTFFPVGRMRWEGKNEDDAIRFAELPVNYDLIETLGITVAEGRSFSRAVASDTMAIIFNQAAIRAMDMKDPVGKTVRLGDETLTIVGVTNDFHFQSLHKSVEPFFFRLQPRQTLTVMVRLAGNTMAGTLKRLEYFYKHYNPGYALQYRFLEDDHRARYAGDIRVSTLSRGFAALAIVISCLGLFGLATYMAERRIKEIGIRKLLGSGEAGIVLLLTGDFTRSVLLAILIAVPASYLLAQQWLERFAYRIPLHAGYFIIAGAVSLAIAWLTVAGQTWRAARVNPSHCLKDQ